jgi:hypothetical protein
MRHVCFVLGLAAAAWTGVSVPRDGKLVFLFGDSWTTADERGRWDEDSVALADPTFPSSGLPKLDGVTGSSGRFLTLAVPLTRLRAMNVPVEGLAHGDRTYLFFALGWAGSGALGARARHQRRGDAGQVEPGGAPGQDAAARHRGRGHRSLGVRLDHGLSHRAPLIPVR